jgi:hypothetical protein
MANTNKLNRVYLHKRLYKLLDIPVNRCTDYIPRKYLIEIVLKIEKLKTNKDHLTEVNND